jgi:integrase
MEKIHRLGVGKDGKLKISVFLRKHKNKKCFYARYKITNPNSANGQRYVTESLQTEVLEYALEKARTRYAEISVLESQNKVIRSDTVSQEIDKFIQEYEKGVGEKITNYSENMLRLYRRGLQKYWKEYIGHLEINKVTHDHLMRYESWRQTYLQRKIEKKEKIHSNTKHHVSSRSIELEINQFKAFLRWAVLAGKYSGTGTEYSFKKSYGDNKRSAFTTRQWTKLTGFMRRKEWLQVGRRGNDQRLQRYRRMLKCYVLFMKNTGLRVGEARNLKWQDIEYKHSSNPSDCLIRINIHPAYSKVKKRSVVIGNEGAYKAIQEFYEFRKNNKVKLNNQLVSDHVELNDPIWCDVDGRVLNEFRQGFNELIQSAGVDKDTAGNKLTIYSMRHTYITEQLKNGVSIYSIASNCNTSTAMIEKYYSDARSSDFEVALTEGYRKNEKSSELSTKVLNTERSKVNSKLGKSSKLVRK